MRVLIIPSPSATHFMPMVPLAWALRAAGHEVLVAGQPDVLGAVADSGLNAVSVGDRSGINDSLLDLVRPGQRPLAWMGRWTSAMMSVFPPVWLRHSENVLPLYLELAGEYRPDLILSDVLEFNALIVGQLLRIPVAHHRYGIDPVSEPLAAGAREALRPLYTGLGLPALPGPSVIIDPCPPVLQLPGLAPGLLMRYVPYNGNGVLPGWLRDERRSAAEGRRVVVSLGSHTLRMNGVPLLRRILRAFEDLADLEVIATVDARYRAELGEVPSTVRLVDPLPLHLLLPGCDAIVHHGGQGTAMTAVGHGLPQLSLPQIADGFACGDRLASVGAGISIEDPGLQDDPLQVRKAVETLLNDPSFRQAARGLRRAAAELPSPAAVVGRLERAVRTHTPRKVSA
ncbi:MULTISPECIES: nucleotide disphospho-sugar-binding domain-containing protein [unclassified Streptomyces]|uniref:nucleotide disphospho-sugar-binding domain-containing protein n=1 Tax=unclassified Streptomyces TaxID=2593676 RepID=UPI0038130703